MFVMYYAIDMAGCGITEDFNFHVAVTVTVITVKQADIAFVEWTMLPSPASVWCSIIDSNRLSILARKRQVSMSRGNYHKRMWP